MKQCDMSEKLGSSLQQAMEREGAFLENVTDENASVKNTAEAWSKKEELGHLIDSAINNHVRFVRASFEPKFVGPTYEQNAWVRAHAYNEMAWSKLIEFWQKYNELLVEVVSRIPEAKLQTECVIGSSAPVTLRFLIEDYVLHMQHHLDHILERPEITTYPGAAAGV